MRAAVHHRYGPPEVLKIEHVDKPVPAADEVLVRVHAASVNPAEWYSMTGLFLARLNGGLFRPKDKRLGIDYAGTVAEVGAEVSEFRPGDAVYGARSGSIADYVCVRNLVIPKPANISFEQAGGIATAAATALQGLRDHGKLQAGQSVLINGASGGVGTFAVQIAKALGAEVTGVCGPDKVDLALSLGADHVIDYTKEDFARSAKRYDLVLDVAGSRPWQAYRTILKPESRFVIVGAPKGNRVIGPLSHIIRIRLAAMRATQTVVFFIASFKREDFQLLNEMMTRGQVRPVVDRVYPLSEVAAAMRYLGEGHARGKIILTLGA